MSKSESKRSSAEKSEVRDYELINSILYICGVKKLFVVPDAMKKSLVIRYHDLQSHTSGDRTVAKMREFILKKSNVDIKISTMKNIIRMSNFQSEMSSL